MLGLCPYQMAPVVEALIVELRVERLSRGPRMLLFELEARGVDLLLGCSLVYWCLVCHGLIEHGARRRKKADYRRWERSRAMELWQMDVVGGVVLAGKRASCRGLMIISGL